MRLIIAFVAVTVAVAIGCNGSSKPAPFDPAKTQEALALISAEAELQKTVQAGPAIDFVGAAARTASACSAFLTMAKTGPGNEKVIHQVEFVHGLLQSVQPKGVDDGKARAYLGQKVHEGLTLLPLAPLPYPADPALSKADADMIAAADLPHGGADEELGVFTTDADQMCACKTKACVLQVVNQLGEHAATYSDVEPDDATIKRINDQQQRLVACGKAAATLPAK